MSRDEIRYRALEHDWNRLRDKDADWLYFQRIVTVACVVLAGLFILGALL